MRAALWHVLMLLWAAGLASGVWWMWPSFMRLELTSDVVSGALWLVLGTLAWVVAFDMGRRRYWRRPKAAPSAFDKRSAA